jgi:RHS repeat-associated protein
MNKNGIVTTYTYNNLNRLTKTVSGGVTNTYTYNNNGNLTKALEAGQTTNYSYNYDNRLTKITYPDATTSIFVYRSDGTRVRTTEGTIIINYLYDGNLPVIERNATNVTQNTYTNNLGFAGGIGGLISQTAAGITTWYHYVHNGATNVSHLTDALGVVVKNYNFEAFGNITAESGTVANTRQFQTKETNSKSKLVYFGQRWYNPVVGRWITPDPLGMVDGPNLYAYLNNNPLNSIDPWGLCEGTGFGGWGDAITYFWNWVIGKPMPTYFDSDTIQVQNMINAPGVEKARDAFRQKNIGKSWDKMEPLTNYGAKFGLSGAWRAGSNSTQQFVGSYTVNIFPNSNRTVDIVLTNSTSFTSFLYGKGPSWNSGPGRTQSQVYYWREEWR